LFISAVPERERDNICSYQQITQKSKLDPRNWTDLNLASTTHDVFILESRIDQEHKKAKKKRYTGTPCTLLGGTTVNQAYQFIK
jgi:hypothetical protein